MSIKLSNINGASTLAGPAVMNPHTVIVPATNYGGISDSTPAAVGDRVAMNGSYCRNISTDTFSCDLRVPVYPVITSAANADQWALQIRGRDHLNRPCAEVLVKSRTNMQTEGQGLYCYSHIDEIRILAASTVTNRLRIGWGCGMRQFSTSDLGAAQTSIAIGSNRRIPLPFVPTGTSDAEVYFRGPVSGGSIVTVCPVANAATMTFTATTATYSTTWDVSGVQAYDVAVTQDGYVGYVVSAAANAVTVNAWVKNGVEGTPATPFTPTNVVTLRTGSATPVVIMRYAGIKSPYTYVVGGLLPGAKVMPLANSVAGTYGGYTGSVQAGIHIPSATFGTCLAMVDEPMTDLVFDVFIKPSALY